MDQIYEIYMPLVINDLELFHADLDSELADILRPREGLLYEMMLYQLGWADRQGDPLPKPRPPRPFALLSLVSCHTISKGHRPALPAAAAMELIHTFMDVHRDVQEGTPRQDGRPSVWWEWGPGQAINVGDGFHALGRSALFRLADAGLPLPRVLRSLSVLDEACIKMCEGQYLDLSHQERLDISRSSYLKMAEYLTGSITSCAITLGAITATDNDQTIQAFQSAGLKLGLAYQIRQDIRDVWSTENGQPASPQLLNKKKLYPIAILLELADLPTKRALGEIYFKRVLEPEDHQRLLDLLEAHDVRAEAESAVTRYFGEFSDALNDADLNEDNLQQLLQYSRHLVQA